MGAWVRIDPENAGKPVTVLMEFGFNVPELSAELFLKENQTVRMGVPPLRIEIITSVSGVDFGPCCETRVSAVLDDVPANVIGLQYLKANKEAAGRRQDLTGLENLPWGLCCEASE